MKTKWIALILGLSIAAVALAAEKRGPATYNEKKFSVNFKNTPVKEALELIVRQAGLNLEAEGELKGTVSYSFSDVTLEEALTTLAKDNQISFELKDKTISVSQGGTGVSTAGPSSEFRFREINVQYVKAGDLLAHVAAHLKKDESVVANQASNVLIFYGSSKSFERLKGLVGLYDQKPIQVLIEAQIVETTANFARDIGISLGDLQPQSAGQIPTFAGSIITPGPSNANLSMAYSLGTTNDGRLLQAKIQAAESVGDAKVVSRPRIYTLNNQRALIHSGITYNVKTLSAVTAVSGGASGSGTGSGTSGGSSTSTSNLAGSIQQISAGLELEVTPTIMGGDSIRLAIRVVKSEPDEGSAVDGIPGIIDNSAESSLIVKDGNTATLAGLLKNTVSKSNNRVPFLGSLPLIGWLFSSHSDRDRATELVILLTPHIVKGDIPRSAENIAKPVNTANAQGEARQPAEQVPAAPAEQKPAEQKP